VRTPGRGDRSTYRDSYVEVEKAFYEAPPELIGREVWGAWQVQPLSGSRRFERSGANLVSLLGQPSGRTGRAMRSMATE
jgi:hypothetical protein